MTHLTLEQIDAAERWIFSAFRIEEMPKDHGVHDCIFALRFLRVMMQEPYEPINAMTYCTMQSFDEAKERFKAMRDKLLEIAGRE